MDATSRVARVPDAIAAVVDGQTVILSPLDYSYHALDPVGARVWELLDQPRSLDDLVADLMAEYDVTDEQCRADVVPFLDRMTQIGALAQAE